MADPASTYTDSLLRELEDRLKAEYEQAKRDIEKKIQLYSDRFKTKDRIWQGWVASGKKTQQEYKTWLTGQMAIGQRWEDMKDTIATDLVNYRKIAKSITKGYQMDAYALNHNYGTFEIESASGLDTSYSLYSRETVEKLYRDNPQILPDPGKDLSKKIAQGQAVKWEKRHIQSCMMQAILQGMDISSVATILQNTVGEADRGAAIRDARTMVTAAQNAGREDSYKRANKLGIFTRKQWVATLDSRTRHEHRMLDGMIQYVDKPFQVEGQEIRFPGDPTAAPWLVWNCRCTLIAAIRNFERTTNTKKGRDTTMLEHPTYDEWEKDRREKTLSILRPDQRRDAYRAGWIREYRGYGGAVDPDNAFAGQYAESSRMTFGPYAVQFEGEMLAIKDRVKANGGATEADIHEAGKLVLDEFNSLKKKQLKEYDDAYAALEAYYKSSGCEELDKIIYDFAGHTKAERDEAQRKADAILNGDEYQKLGRIAGEKWDIYKGTIDGNISWLKSQLMRVREVGMKGLEKEVGNHLIGHHSRAYKLLKDAYDAYPTDWVKASINRGRLEIGIVPRGYYSDMLGELKLSTSNAGGVPTSFHELGHRFEYSVPGIKAAEKEFYDRRTAGCPLEQLGAGYGPNEKARKDQFLIAYMGKDYGGLSYELASMGFEYAYTDPTALAKDPDMAELIYGMLFLL